jgi:hypothetical protein
MNYLDLLNKVIKGFYPSETEPNVLGILAWNEPTDKQVMQHFSRTGEQLKIQRRKYTVKEVLFEKSISDTKSGVELKLYISPIEEYFFYVVSDTRLANAGFSPGHISMVKYRLRKIMCSKCGHNEEDVIERIEDIRMGIR